jgi:hypothetical protein
MLLTQLVTCHSREADRVRRHSMACSGLFDRRPSCVYRLLGEHNADNQQLGPFFLDKNIS